MMRRGGGGILAQGTEKWEEEEASDRSSGELRREGERRVSEGQEGDLRSFNSLF